MVRHAPLNRNTAVDFDQASSAAINVGRVEEPSSAITILFWSRPDDLDNNKNEGFVTKRAVTSGQPFISYFIAGDTGGDNLYKIAFKLGISGDLKTIVTASNAGLSGWHHWAGTWSSGQKLRLYKDGEINTVGASAVTGTIDYNVSGGPFDTYIGWDEIDNIYLDAQMKYVQIFTKCLAPGEIRMSLRHPFSVMDHCVGAWRLNNVTDIKNLAGNNHNGVNSNATNYPGAPTVTEFLPKRRSYKSTAVTVTIPEMMAARQVSGILPVRMPHKVVSY